MMHQQLRKHFWRSTTVNANNVDQFYVLDLDRTLFMSEKSLALMQGVIALYDPELGVLLQQQYDAYEAQGESFSVRDFIAERVDAVELQKIEAKYHELAATHDLLYPGAAALIEYIQQKNAGIGILTYGSQQGQTMKITADPTLRTIPFLVTSETYKGALIAGWRQDDDLYHLPEELGGGVAKTIIFVDDKPFSFKGLPIDCRGYWVKSIFDAGAEMLPDYVTPVADLSAVLATETRL